MNDKELKALEQDNPILQVAVELGIKVRSNMGKCFQNERHAADSDEFTLFFNLAKNSFFCKICSDVGGNVIDLVSQYQSWSQQKAVEWLKHRIEFDQQTQEMYYRRGKNEQR
jgi:hypothetical protein